MKKIFYLLLSFICAITSFAQMLPYQNPKLSSEERAKDLISRLTAVEKAALMCDVSEAIPRLGIKKFNWWSEALHGYANNNNVTVFPEPIGMAASFDDELVYHIFDAVSDEARTKYHDAMRHGEENRRFLSLSVWTPNVNIFRDPRWGRGQETYGEDPYLMSRMGISVVKGLQGPEDSRYKKLLACAKHFAVHSGPESTRHTVNLTDISPRDLNETYLPAFKAVVTEAGVREVMCAYQRLDNEPCCGNNKLLQKILRDDWGFKYMVVSDCGAISDFWEHHKVSPDPVHAAATAALAGTDVECGFDYAFSRLPDAIEKGLMTNQEIDKHVMRLLIGRFDLGEMDNDSLVPWSKLPASVINSDAHKTLALDMARETMTLLQNKNNILPLSKSSEKIAVIGPNANADQVMWGNYNGVPVHTITALDGIRTKLPEDKILYDKGCDVVEGTITETIIPECSFESKAGVKATYWNTPDFSGDSVATDRFLQSFKLTTAGQHEFAPGVHLKKFSAKYQTMYAPAQSGEIVLRIEAIGDYELQVNGQVLYRNTAWRLNPSRYPLQVVHGKTYNIEVRYMQTQDWADATFSMNIGKEKPTNFDVLLEKLKDIQTVVFIGGISSRLEGEEMPVMLPGFKDGDRTDIELPLVQRNCLKALKDAGKKIIFVNCSGSAVGLVPETQTCDAILQAWYAGEASGQAIADALFGDVNPSGHLPITFYKNIQQIPAFENYSMKGRTYRYFSDPLFPFGFGLSYTTFSIGDAALEKSSIKAGEKILMTVPVSNTGAREGTEIVQVYVRNPNDSDGPIKTLRAFKRVSLKAGEQQDVTIELLPTTFELFDASSNSMKIKSGSYELLYGTSSDPKDLKSVNVVVQ
ncbi:MAG TPA: xylan 1,4-beta-xylosidase [Bacteroidota bacterium]|nr:xylan 1,4-beta-xylosidase [Bacteroidota bacterium]